MAFPRWGPRPLGITHSRKQRASRRRPPRVRRVLAWAATAVILPIVMIGVGLALTDFWGRPRLSIVMAKALVTSSRTVAAADVHEYRIVFDLEVQCATAIVDHFASSEHELPPPTSRQPALVVYGVYLENIGRSALNDIRLTFKTATDQFDIVATPQLVTTQSSQTDPSRAKLHTVTVASLAPGAKGVLLVSVPAPSAQVSVRRISEDKYTMQYSLGVNEALRENQMSFSGASQLSVAPIQVTSMDDLLMRQKETFGLKAVALPIEPVELPWYAGQTQYRLPFSTCESANTCQCYSVPLVRRAKPSSATKSENVSNFQSSRLKH